MERLSLYWNRAQVSETYFIKDKLLHSTDLSPLQIYNTYHGKSVPFLVENPYTCRMLSKNTNSLQICQCYLSKGYKKILLGLFFNTLRPNEAYMCP